MSAKYVVNWALSGFRDIEHKAGDIITAAENEVDEIAKLVKAGVISIVGKIEATFDSADDLVKLAKEKYGYDLDPTLSKDAMLAEIASLAAGDGDSDDTTQTGDLSTKTRAELVEYAKTAFNYDLKGNLSKDAMLAEIASLAKK